MKKYLLIFILMCSVSSRGEVILAKASASLTDPELKNICRQMTSDHLSDIQHLNSLSEELKRVIADDNSINKSDKISFLMAQIKDYADRIRFISKPEWNSETIPIILTWTVSNKLFFDNSEYLKLKSKNVLLSLTYPHSYISDKKLTKAYFLNSENQDVAKDLSLEPLWPFRSSYELDRSFVIVYNKSVSALEACQFLTTLMFEVDVRYVQMIFNSSYKFQKKIYLIYKNE